MKSNKSSGFTLAEMAIVVLLISILMAMGIGLLSSQMENAAYSSTRKKQEVIKDALVAYLRTNFRLPCPDVTNDPAIAVPASNVRLDGIEDRATCPGPPPVPDPTTACVANFGVLPYITLGLSRDMVQDGWENYFLYQVSNVAPNNWTLSTSFNPGNTGLITINDRTPAPAGAIFPVTTTAVAVVVSPGKNGLAGWTVKGTQNVLPVLDELENTRAATDPTPDTFYRREYTDNTAAAGGPFDDLVMFLLPESLLTPLRQDGTLKAASDSFAAAQSTVITAARPTCTLPATAAMVGLLGNVYGQPIVYTRNDTPLPMPSPITAAVPAIGTLAFTLQAGGELRTVSIDTVRAVFTAYGICP